MAGDDIRRFFAHCFDGNTKGWLCVAVGRDPYRDENGEYQHRDWSERAFSWPRQSDEALQYIAETSLLGDVYVCPYPMKQRRRSKGEAAQRILIHADVDQDLDETTVAELGGFVVWSGTPGHGHVYLPLAWPVTPAQHEALCRGLAAALGGDAKYSDNDLMRPPGTANFKPTVDGGDPSPVTALWCSNGRVDPRGIAGPLGVDFANPAAGLPAARQHNRADRDTGTEVNLDRYPGVRAALEHRTEDRSADTYRVIAACRHAGLTLAETTWAVRTRDDLTQRLADRGDDDVLAIWLKLDDEERATKQRALVGTAAHPHTRRSSDVPTLAGVQRILDRVAAEVRLRGLVGEERLAEILYLVFTSRLLDKQVSTGVKGHSASGKSYTVATVLRFFPPEAYLEFTAMSQRALVYSPEQYAHRTLVIYEMTALREGVEDDLTAYFVRSLLSEGRIEYPVTVRDKETGGFTTKTIVKEGPTNLVFTTTETRVHAENETRILSLATDDSREQTARVLRQLADETAGGNDLAEWHDLQVWLATGEHRVTIPYAERLSGLVPPVAVRLRRDFGSLLALIRAHAVLHQASRDHDPDGRIVADLDDYVVVRGLVADVIAEGVGHTVSPGVRETVAAVEMLAGGYAAGVPVRAVADELRLDRSNVSRRLRVAAEGGYLRNLEDKRGKPGRWVVGDPLPDAVSLLPDPGQLDAHTHTPRTAPDL